MRYIYIYYNMPDTTIEPTYECEPVVAVECECVNQVYKIKYIECSTMMDDDDDPQLMTRKVIKFFEVTEQPIPSYTFNDTEWNLDNPTRNINENTSCCSKSFVEYVEKEIKNNNTDFPTTIFVKGETWIILEATKIT